MLLLYSICFGSLLLPSIVYVLAAYFYTYYIADDSLPFPPHIYEGVRLRLKPKYLQRIGVEAKNNVVHCQAAIFDCR